MIGQTQMQNKKSKYIYKKLRFERPKKCELWVERLETRHLESADLFSTISQLFISAFQHFQFGKLKGEKNHALLLPCST